MKKTPIKTIHLLLPLALASLMGCVTSGTTTRVTSQNDPERKLITSSKLDNQDCAIAATTLVNRLMDSVVSKGKLESPPNEPALLLVSRIVNSTGQHLDMDMVTG